MFYILYFIYYKKYKKIYYFSGLKGVKYKGVPIIELESFGVIVFCRCNSSLVVYLEPFSDKEISDNPFIF